MPWWKNSGAARPLSTADQPAGVGEDVRVRRGGKPAGPVGRRIRVKADDHVFLLFTDRDDLAAELVALIDRYRWQIELFCKWIKGILGCRHWRAEAAAGMTLPIYCALMASVLLGWWTGGQPTQRQWEARQLYWLGWVSLEELTAGLTPKKKSA